MIHTFLIYLAPVATTSSAGAGAGSPVSCRKISSRLTAVGRSSFRSQPDSTTARARSPRMELSFAYARNLLEALLHRRGLDIAVAPSHFDQQRLGAARAVLQIAHGIRSHHLAFCD